MPVVADGVAYAMSGYQAPNLLAIRLGREGDLTGTDAILWQNQRGNSYTPSPVLRSEEHTSELQSLRHLVCRLLLEKKKKQQQHSIQHDERRRVPLRDTHGNHS